MGYWVEKDNKYISLKKLGKTCHEIVCYQEVGYAELYEKDFYLMALALNKREEPIILLPLDLAPLSSQLQRFTDDTYNTQAFEMEDGSALNSRGESHIIHKKTGLKFKITN